MDVEEHGTWFVNIAIFHESIFDLFIKYHLLSQEEKGERHLKM